MRGESERRGFVWRAEWIVLLLLSALVLLFLAYQVYGLQAGYSYWFDELFSVVAGKLPVGEAVGVYINDPHPPFYPLLLTGWIALFGDSEAATRSLSVIFALGTLWVLSMTVARVGRRVVAMMLVIVLSNWLICHYAQEARPYAALLFVSAMVFAFAVNDRRGPLLLTLVLLGLTHYFGALQAFAYLAWLAAFESRTLRSWLGLAAAGTAILVWPAIFLVVGRGMSLVGGNFWIEATPADALRQSAMASAPWLWDAVDRFAGLVGLDAGAGGLLLRLAAVAGIGILLLVRLRGAGAGEGMRRNVLRAAFVALLTTLGAAAINLHTPVSTDRNFIVMVPLASYLLAEAIAAVWRSRAGAGFAVAGLAVIALVGQLQIRDVMAGRFLPHQDWHWVADAVVAEAGRTGGGTYFYSRWGSGFYHRLSAYYMPEGQEVGIVEMEKLGQLEPGAIVFFGNLVGHLDGARCVTELQQALDARGMLYRAEFANQAARCSNGYVVLE
ncbi:glycosyltransferase family 39 protein [Oceanibacterium hippocampi]|nr:glycosyltransferase family 39 protein [Oceanibacterium hippocampi]